MASAMSSQQSQQVRASQNRYAHLVTSNGTAHKQPEQQQYHQQPNQQQWQHQDQASSHKPPPLAGARQGAYASYYYSSFSSVDWREQWSVLKNKLLEKAEEPEAQRKLILVIVCCALLLDNMLYMVIVPIIPDYLRSIGSWSTYTENAKWIRSNSTRGGHAKWERVGGQVVYEGEDSAVGFLFASKAIVQLFINPFSGAIIDRIGYELPMMIGLTVMFFSTMVFACGQTYSVLFLARSLQGVGSAFADTAGLAMIADRFTEETERQRALGVALAFISFGCLVAPPFGAVLYQAAGKEVPFIILSLVCLLDGSLLLLVTPPGTFAQILPSYKPPAAAMSPNVSAAGGSRSITTTTITNTKTNLHATTTTTQVMSPSGVDVESSEASADGGNGSGSGKRSLQRQKSLSRRLSMTAASAGEAPRGTPIYVLFRDPCIACCSGALVVANVSLAFLEPTISIWMQNTMTDIEEWQMGMIWLPAFVPHVLGVYSTVKLADKYPKFQWLIAAIGLVLEGVSCLMVPFCTSFWSLIVPISVICFGVALIDTAILPTLGFLVDTRYVSVYGSIYAIADISYSLSYAVGPIIAGGIVEAIGFTALNILIAIVTLGYTPILMMLRTIHDYEPFEADAASNKQQQQHELAPFGKFGRAPIDSDDETREGDVGVAQQQQQRYAAISPSWAKTGSDSGAALTNTRPASPASPHPVPLKSALVDRQQQQHERPVSRTHSVKIVESPTAISCGSGSNTTTASNSAADMNAPPSSPQNPFLNEQQ